ncbi:gluconokinase [Candidatus Pseudothioglobus singularis]|jgi:carbohydrate kinase (thermoresistant glucokinase family)|uniref:Gluconokinase n=1 Tax=Candidatus Pseudothioglobus singularis PS1 TaxID=1125411 RepID=A0A0M5KRZ2_9GAMM|nr:gluconokinase, GntK/IdnK-type [Candidatus Pseudothioglobus singularis]ALE02286.1 gluconate kinase [Candidatus Pseudothioglobus singularis PS1]
MLYLIMGVSGSGKSSVGVNLAKTRSIPFYDADDFHNYLNIEKMKQGQSLNDLDRMPWLNLLSSKIKEWNEKGDSVLACSALKQSYRKLLSIDNEITFIFLDGSYDLIFERLSKRKDHFFSKEMLSNQFLDLEKPKDCIKIPIDQSLKDICSMINKKITYLNNYL